MIFMRYNGGAPDGDFTVGKVYFAHDALEHEAVGRTEFYVTDDNDQKFKFRFDDYFQELEEVYAVWLGGIEGVGLEVGETVVIDRAEDDTFGAAGHGFFRREHFEILDGTNLKPGVYVCDVQTGRWLKVMRVDGKMNLSTEEDSEVFHTPFDFKFAVADGAIIDMPIVYCVNSTGIEELTESETYVLVASLNDMVCVKNDKGVVGEYDASRFSWVQSEN